MRKFCLAFLCLCVLFSLNRARYSGSASLLKQLLDLTAPPPVNLDKEEAKTKKERPPEFYDAKNIPPDDAPMEALLDYWESQDARFGEFRHNQKPTKKSLRRIIEVIEKDHSLLPNYLKLFPAETEISNLVRGIYETEKQSEQLSAGWFDQVRLWLGNNSDMFISELIERAFAEAINVVGAVAIRAKKVFNCCLL